MLVVRHSDEDEIMKAQIKEISKLTAENHEQKASSSPVSVSFDSQFSAWFFVVAGSDQGATRRNRAARGLL